MNRWVAIAIAAAAGALLGAPPATAKRGIKSLWGADLKKAVALFEDAVRQDPKDADALTNLGVALARLGRWSEAEKAYRAAIQLEPTRWSAYAGLADATAQDPRRWEQRDEVIALLDAGLERVAADAAGRVSLTLGLANLERSIGRTRAARARLDGLEAARLSPEQRKRVLDLTEAIAGEERARALVDLPEPQVSDGERREASRAGELLTRGDAQAALAAAERLATAHPAWRAPRSVRAKAFEALGRFDDAERELTVLVHLAPSLAESWRGLGLILAAHGGALDADRADEALRQALVLEPAWWDLWLVRAQVASRRGLVEEARRALERYLREAPARAGDGEVRRLRASLRLGSPAGKMERPGTRSAPPPSPRAREIYREVQRCAELGDPLGQVPALVAATLAESPGFVDAAATSYAVTGQIPLRTVESLWSDGESLLELACKVRALGRDAKARALVRPWIDRALELGVVEARFERGLLWIDEGDRSRGREDLLGYVASGPEPAQLAEARVLIGSLGDGMRSDSPSVRARTRLLADETAAAAEAVEALGGRCDAKTPDDRLAELGRVDEWAGDLKAALACYAEALRRIPGDEKTLGRVAGIGARAPVQLASTLEPQLERAVKKNIPAAHWALARLALARGDADGAYRRVERFLAEAGADDPALPEARAARDRIAGARAEAERRVFLRRMGVAGGAAALVLAVLLAFFQGAPLARALGRRPTLFPEVARAIGELRHDVLKHRTSVIGLVAAGEAATEEVERVLWQPERASDVIAASYEQLRRAARGRGTVLRRLAREPTFGPLVRDLRRAEALVALRKKANLEGLRKIDVRLREVHAERLASLLRLGPRTTLDAARIAGWIRGVEAEVRVRGGTWISPVLELHGLELEFPVEEAALANIFANLLRNAQAVVGAEAGEGGVLIRIAEERDEVGRRMLVLVVGDSSSRALSIEAIERRESGRGLAIVRDLVHEWRGHLVIRRESSPWSKGVGACFPA